jgi:hypothetical protein
VSVFVPVDPEAGNLHERAVIAGARGVVDGAVLDVHERILP